MSKNSFELLKINKTLLKNLVSVNYTQMTPIQEKTLPHILSGKDVIGQGKTGSGKTAAFGIGLLNKLDVKQFRIQSLVLCPTRELADQVAKEIRKLARTIHNVKVLTLCGGTLIGPQLGSLEHGAHIIIGTPGRIEDHIRKKTLKLDCVNLLILDEADRMLEMGFQKSLEAIISKIPKKRQTLLFSATYPDAIQSIAEHIMIKPITVKVDSIHTAHSIQQHFYKLENNKQRETALKLLLLKYRPESTLVFCNTKKDTEAVAQQLKDHGFSASALNGDLEQNQRDEVLACFINKSCSILVATDVAARGLDIDGLDAVINYHLARNTKTHTHRIGRTGRAGQKGTAHSLYIEQESYKLLKLDAQIDPNTDYEPLPPFHLLNQSAMKPSMVTLKIYGGKKQKLRPGDILGALTGLNGISGKQVGKIQIFQEHSYVAVNRNAVKHALKKLTTDNLKGRTFRVKRVRN